MNLNKIFTVAALTTTMLFTACSDVIEVEPIFQKDGAQIFTSLDDYQLFLKLYVKITLANNFSVRMCPANHR